MNARIRGWSCLVSGSGICGINDRKSSRVCSEAYYHKDIEDDMVYLAAMLHDIGKPDCQIYDTKDGKINMHYYGHHKSIMTIV